MEPLDLNKAMDAAIEAALREDMPKGDLTSESIIPSEARSEAFFLAKEEGVLAGMDVASRVFAKIDTSVIVIERFRDGSRFNRGDKLARMKGPTIALLKG
ncbi:MAG: nicotinate-nucleotide diphosphorylase (carboxylating), partial [Candidatus Aminicenantes bacterium]|nr:nicotinate-nucleotide diphosphorylase (carboxylating) [Candidatus Aminicenantes bacterium]